MRTFPDAIQFCLSATISALAGRRYLSCLWELTYRCTARCRMCGYWKRPSSPQEELDLVQIKLGIDRIHEYGCRLVNFTGGEPTLRPDLEEVIAHGSQRRIWTSVVTNGSLLTRGRVRELRRSGLDNLLVSLDSVSSEDHDAQRQMPGSFAQVQECVNWIREEFLQGHRTGGIMCVISRRNCIQLADLVRLARDRGVFVLFQPYHVNKTGDAEPIPEIGDAQIAQLLDSGRGRESLLNSRSYLEGMKGFGEHSPRPRCHAGQKYFSIDPSGYLHPCVDLPAVGHILQSDIAIVRSNRAQESVSGCPGCWYCFRGEADTSLSVAGCLEKARLGLSVLRHNASLRG